MPKYLVQVNYTAEGAKGLLREGGSKRRSAAQAGIESAGGRLESMYFAFGDADAIVYVARSRVHADNAPATRSIRRRFNRSPGVSRGGV